jgi:AraC-like DNA-binding protein
MKDNVLFSVSIEQLLQRKIGVGMGNNLIATSNLSEYIDLFSFPLRVDAFVFLVCLKGNASLTINLTEWNVRKNTYLISLPENIIGVNSISNDFEGYVILFSMEYLRKISIDLNDVLPYYIHVRNHPCFNVAAINVNKITKFFDLIYSSLNEEYSNRREGIIKGLVISIIFKIAEDIEELALKAVTVKTKSKEYYFMKFMDLLLLNFREHHNVGFYSDKLALTPKYLSSLIKEISGASASQWINDYIIVEAKTLLKSSDMNVKQISDYLFFSTPSFFNKYFKQHTKLTPKQYRIR